tara:strand:+ start:2183 stop:4144 length:1962 start_codon:yes stop_codon:yes gene_type:complete
MEQPRNSIAKNFIFFILAISVTQIPADNFKYNTFNNHGVIGLVNMPSARFNDSSVYGLTIYDGTPDQKITFTSNPYDWLEASVFYTNIQDKTYPGYEYQDYKDKGFNIKIRLKEEGKLPAIAIGINDIAGTGFYGSEYVVGSYGINNFDFHFGLGWGSYNGSKFSFNNPFGYLDERFNTRSDTEPGRAGTGSFNAGRYFSDKQTSPFFGLSYLLDENFLFKFEHDTTVTYENIEYEAPKNQYSIGLEFLSNKNFSFGIAYERGNTISFKFNYKNNPQTSKQKYRYQPSETKKDADKYKKLIRNLEKNGIGVNKIVENSSALGIELTQFTHSSLDVIEEIIIAAKVDSGIKKEVKKDLKIVDLEVISELDQAFNINTKTIYERKSSSRFDTSTNFVFRPFIASREEFFKGAIVLENNSEYIIKDNFIFSSNLKYSVADNFDDLRFPPIDVYPAQVRSDIKQYLKNFDDGIKIGRAQFDYYVTPKKNNHLMFTAGILEEMFSGIGFEYLYFRPSKNYAYGFEVFDVKKRNYDMRFRNIDYRNVTGSINFYYRNYGLIPFDLKASYGEYLAGDEGLTIELSRSFANGVKYGIFASKTDVSSDQFGEGSFDKGIFFNIPIFGNLVNYSWRPLTKDPGAKLIRKHTLHDLLIKFKPIN